MELKTEHLSKRFKDKQAVNDVSLTLTSGIWGLLGANGAGKTTLMRMIAGIMAPTEGEISFDGTNIRKMGEAYRALFGFLPQDFGYFRDFTVKDYLEYMAALKDVPPRETGKKINQLLDVLTLSDVKHKKIAKLSGGMKRRVGIAQAMLNEPKVLIMDEPTAGLDPKGREDVTKIIANYRRHTGATVIIISHSMEDMAVVADKLLVMNKGKLWMFGTVEEVFKNGAELRKIGLNVPIVTRVFYELKKAGVPVPDDVFTVDRAVRVLKEIRDGGGNA